MEANSRWCAWTVCLAAGMCLPGLALGDMLSTTEIQITDTQDHESRPTLGPGIVIYTSVDISANANARIHGWTLDSAGQPIQSVSVSDPSDPYTDDRLNDISGSDVLYTARDTVGPGTTRLVRYDLAIDQRTDVLSDAGSIFEARIHDNRMVFVQADSGSSLVKYADKSYPGVIVTLSGPGASHVAIGSDLIVWTEGGTEIWAFNPITQDYGIVEQSGGSNPATDADWVVYERATGSGVEIVAKQLSLAINQGFIQVVDSVVVTPQASGVSAMRNPDIDGDLIVYEGIPAAGSSYEVYLYRLSDGSTYRVTNDSADQQLVSVHGDKVAYGDFRSGTVADIWLSTLTFLPGVSQPAVDSGRYSALGFHNPNDTMYEASVNGSRSFFVFDLTGVSSAQPIVSATLELDVGTVSQGTFGGIAYTLSRVGTGITTLLAGGSGLTAIYDDLGSGPPLSGVVDIAPGDQGSIKPIPLNSVGLAELSVARGGLFAIGGSPSGLGGNFAFSGTDVSGVQLVIEFGDAVLPTLSPASFALLATLLAGVSLVMLRTRRR